MKKATILIFLALMAFAPMAWAQFSGGTGTADDPYLISSKDDWNVLHNQVKDGNLYTGKFFKMTADIGTVTTPIGKTGNGNDSGNYFEGTFDGDGHILTVNFNFNRTDNIGAFCRLNNATIKNLHVKGKIESGDDGACSYYGGIAGRTKGNTNIIACRSSVFIDGYCAAISLELGEDTEGYYYGGFVGSHANGTLTFVNCLFNGRIRLDAINYVGGFVGARTSGKISLVNCLSATKKFEDSYWSDHSSTFVSKGDGANVAMYHSIFTKKCGDDKDGVDARDWSPIEIINYLGDTYWKPDVEDGGQVFLPRTNVEVSLSPYAFAGEGTEASPYLIQSANDWRGLARDIYLWRTYQGQYFKLTNNDISLWETVEYEPSTMLGVTEYASFQGILDGDGHTLTINYTDNSNEHYCGPFRYINGATIKNLHVTGSIYKEKKKHIGGLVGKAYGTNHIINCRSSVDIQANTDGDGSHGGFLGDLRDGTTYFTSCVFNGKLRGTRTKKWGGFVGWVADGEQANFTNCVFNPALVNVKNDGNRTFARRNDGDDVSFTSCYYFQTLGSAQGKEACRIIADEHVTMTPYGTEEPGVNGGVTSYLIFHNYNPCVMYGGVLYSGNGDQVKLNLSLNGEPVEDYSTDHFIASAGTINGSTDPRTLTMPNDDVTISLAPTALGLFVGDMNDPYLIYTFEQWQQMCSRINNGEYDSYHGGYYSEKCYKLMADITLTEIHNSGNSEVMVGISTSDHTKFGGTFDGNGHTITLDITDNSDDDYCAPFRYLRDGTIKNLHVAGTIVKTDKKNAGGLVGKAEGSNTIRNCRSSVDIFFDDEGDCSSGGFVGELRDGSNNNTNFYNCLFDGTLRGNVAYCWGGFVGWVADDCWARFNHCLFNPTNINFDINDSDDNSKTFARVHSGGHIVVETCYYKTLIKDAQGSTNASGFGDEQLRFNLGHGWEIVTEVDVAKVVPIMKKYSLSGEGTEASPYLITSTDDWNGLAGNIFLGETYSGEFLQLTDNITVNRMIGTGTTSTAWNQYSFSGTFDGADNTMTFDYSTNAATEGLIAPFRFVDDATIKNLVVDGTIVTANKYAGGIIGRVDGNTALTNCRSSVTINSNFAGEGCHGGLIGLIRSEANVTITGCLFDGKMLSFPLGDGGATTHCGGFVGEAFDAPYSASVSVINSLYAPAELLEGETAVDITCSSTLVHYTNDDQATITNSYYMQPLGTAQGKQARTISGSEYAIVENAGTATEYDVSGIISYGTGIGRTFMVLSEEEEEEVVVLYAGNGDNVSLDLSCMLPEGHELHGYQTSAGTLDCIEDTYTLTMPDEDVVITANVTLVTVYREIEGYGDGNYCWAFIASPVEGSILPTAVTDLVGTYDSSTGLYDYDLYRFNPLANLEWENYNNATHQDGFNLVNGMGYLYATKETKTLAFTGTFNTDNSKTLENLPAGFNLVGNPFTVDAYVNRPYYTLNSDGSAIEAKDADDDQRIAPCHGVIVEVSESEAVTFNTSGEFSAGPSNGGLNIALVQTNTRSNAVMDNAIVSFNKGERLGKFYFGTQSANIYIPQGGKEYAIAFSKGQGEMPLNFKANENGQYTITINPEGVEMAYLHLVDNLTGADVDLLQPETVIAGEDLQSPAPSYTFTAKVTDYESRFRLVFATNNEDGPLTGSEAFAFFSNGNWIIANEGSATLQVIDINGRILSSESINGSVSKAIDATAGVYMICLINGENVKVQKIVVR